MGSTISRHKPSSENAKNVGFFEGLHQPPAVYRLDNEAKDKFIVKRHYKHSGFLSKAWNTGISKPYSTALLVPTDQKGDSGITIRYTWISE